MKTVAAVAYWIGNLGTFFYLVYEDWPTFNWWNWIIIIPINELLAFMWPIYWLILRPFFG